MAAQHSTTTNFYSRYKYNAKELDKETGYYYYGARYYEPSVSQWLSVDPLVEKYPSMSPYNYVADNPIKYIDPDGKRIRGVKYKNGKITYSRQARLNGTKRYVEARLKTKSGRASIMNMIDKKKRFTLRVTDRVIVKRTGNGKVAIVGGLSDSKRGILVVSTNTAKFKNITDAQLKDAVTVGAVGNLIKANVSRDNLLDPLSIKNDDYLRGYKAAYNDSGMAAFESNPKNAYKFASMEERINALGAHEEVHLFNDVNINASNDTNSYRSAYNRERPAFEEEIRARLEYRQQNN